MDPGRANNPSISQDSLALRPIASARAAQQSPSPSRRRSPPPQASTPGRRRPTLEDRRQPSIRLRRLGSASTLESTKTSAADYAYDPPHVGAAAETTNRRRSSSEPHRPAFNVPDSNTLSLPRGLARPASTHLPRLEEEVGRPSTTVPPPPMLGDDLAQPPATPTRPGMLHRASAAALSALRIQQQDPTSSPTPRRRPRRDTAATEYETSLVDWLDIVDPEIATLSTLTNVQNSLFIPDLGRLLNRRATYTVTREPSYWRDLPRPPSAAAEQLVPLEDVREERPGFDRTFTISSKISETDDKYAVLPHGVELQGWSIAEKEELNDHVRHMLHSRRAAIGRGWKGFKQYVRRPLGLFVTVYATLVTLFGLAWVLFLIGWINVGGRQSYIINVIDNVLVALFAIIGDGLAPFRAIDTYHMCFIAHYHYLTWKLRKKRNMPALKNENDLPVVPGIDAEVDADFDIEAEAGSSHVADAKSIEEKEEESVLTIEQQRKLKHHEDKFSKSHTFYKPHETETHHAFPLRILVAVVCLLDCHSLLQIALGTCTWSISYHVRPFALTTVILCFSITCNIMGGVMISVGDHLSRKKDVVERIFRQELTEQAINKIEKRRQKEGERNEELDAGTHPELENFPTKEGKPSRALGELDIHPELDNLQTKEEKPSSEVGEHDVHPGFENLPAKEGGPSTGLGELDREEDAFSRALGEVIQPPHLETAEK